LIECYYHLFYIMCGCGQALCMYVRRVNSQDIGCGLETTFLGTTLQVKLEVKPHLLPVQ
jgi:hypothetical protein